MSPDDEPLVRALVEQRRLGFVGLEPAEAIAHSRRYEAALPVGVSVLDLGSGGGVPGLVVAFDRPDVRMTLLDVRQKRADQLERLVRRLGLGGRVQVACEPADRFAREHAEAFDAVIARLFGPPGVVAELAAQLVRPGGRLVVSAAPDERWWGVVGWRPADGAAPAGLLVFERP